MTLAIRDFASEAQADIALAGKIEQALRTALRTRGRASMAVSGGSTPQRLYQRLSRLQLDWSRVSVVLADERWVDPGIAGSNETFIRENLLQGEAATARFYGLKTADPSPRDAAQIVSRKLLNCPLPFDVVVLGMGNDGHTLSWFPDATGLEAALEPDGPLAAAITARPSAVTGPHTERLTLTRAALEQANLVALLIHGEQKRAVLEHARAPGPVSAMPIRALIRDAALKLCVYSVPTPETA
jgi:6-phosphogluconolactonase